MLDCPTGSPAPSLNHEPVAFNFSRLICSMYFEKLKTDSAIPRNKIKLSLARSTIAFVYKPKGARDYNLYWFAKLETIQGKSLFPLEL